MCSSINPTTHHQHFTHSHSSDLKRADPKINTVSRECCLFGLGLHEDVAIMECLLWSYLKSSSWFLSEQTHEQTHWGGVHCREAVLISEVSLQQHSLVHVDLSATLGTSQSVQIRGMLAQG